MNIFKLYKGKDDGIVSSEQVQKVDNTFEFPYID